MTCCQRLTWCQSKKIHLRNLTVIQNFLKKWKKNKLCVCLHVCVRAVQGYESGEASQCGNPSLHGDGGYMLEHPHVSLA